MKPLVFIHGWGMNSTIWRDVIAELNDYTCHTIDLGFIKGGETNWHDLEKPAVYIGHSLGALWALKQPALKPAAFISVSGFTSFTSFTPRAAIEKMQRGLELKPETQMKTFWKRAGYQYPGESDQPGNIEKELLIPSLDQGLGWLKDWDGRDEFTKRNYPTCIIASRNDRIVPEQATNEQWPEQHIFWHETASHSLPQQEPAWLANQIKSFLMSTTS